MEKLEALRKLNPGLPFFSIYDSEFARFGRVVDFDASALIEACEKAAEMPESGSRYVPDMPELEAVALEKVQHELRGEGSCQIGCCWGHSSRLNCLEYHRASEHNVAVSDIVLLLAAQQDMEANELPEGKITAFFVPRGATIEVYATTLHYAPCTAVEGGFKCVVVLPKGTNTGLEKREPKCLEDKMLFARNKWLLVHPEAAAPGQFVGLVGENITLD